MSWTDTDLPTTNSQTWHDTSLVKLQIDILLCPSYTSISQHLNNRLFCRYPGDQVPPRTSSRSKQKARHANHMPLHVVNLSMNRMAQASSGAATCPVASAPAARPGAAPGPPRVLWPQLPLPGPGQLRGRHVSCDLSSRCPARGSSGAATCPVASAPAAQPRAAPGPPCVLRPQLLLPSPGQLRGHHVCPGGPTVGVLLK
jgi:hypothetical protein